MKKIALPITFLFGFFLGWFTNDILQNLKTEAAKAAEYKVVRITMLEGGKEFQQILSSHAKQGWGLVPWPVLPYIVFER